MNSFSEELRKERENKGITLSDIALKTRIHIKYLQAIEQGAFDILPQTYVRAFIKAYAEAIGYNAVEALRKYDIHSTPEHREENAAINKDVRLYLRPETAEEDFNKEKKKSNLLFGSLIVVAGTLLALYLLNYFDTAVTPQHVEETSFQEIVKEQEKVKIDSVVIDTIKPTPVIVPEIPKVDSLVLRVVAKDSIWITITRDSLPPRSGYMSQGRYRTYVAKKYFYLSLSDPGLARIYLNGVELTSLGERGKRLRNIKISAENLTQ